MDKSVIIIGGGLAGMQAALSLKELGVSPLILEKEALLGGKLRRWDRLFPTFTPAAEVLDKLVAGIREAAIEVQTDAEVAFLAPDGSAVELKDGRRFESDAILMASGFELFDATLKEEYGYGIYENVFTSADLEQMFHEGRVLKADGTPPRRVAILHCVGSRDEKVHQNHCSRVCCVTGVKQAIEIKQLYPTCEVFNFYMDMRMFGPGYEEMYRSSQQDYGINHIRGKISEASRMIDGRLQIKAEDTLVGRPMRMTVDMLILLVGMCCGQSNERFAESGGLELRPSNYMKPLNPFGESNYSNNERVFFAGTVKAPKNVSETLHDAISAAHHIFRYLQAR